MKLLGVVRYRASQFFLAVNAVWSDSTGGAHHQLSSQDRTLLSEVLPLPAQQALFDRMSPNDQQHALAVAQTLRKAGHTHPALLQAALLHDVAKCLGQPIPHRVLIVLLETFWPAALRRLSQLSVVSNQLSVHQSPITNHQLPITNYQLSHLHPLRRPFVIHAHHPAIGADWAEQADCHSLAVALIRHHQDKQTDLSSEDKRLLAVLQWADNLN